MKKISPTLFLKIFVVLLLIGAWGLTGKFLYEQWSLSQSVDQSVLSSSRVSLDPAAVQKAASLLGLREEKLAAPSASEASVSASPSAKPAASE